MELASPLTSGENNSDIKSNGMGPKPMENAIINMHSELRGINSIFNAKWVSVLRYQKYSPNPYKANIMSSYEVMSNLLLPNLSISNVEKAVAKT